MQAADLIRSLKFHTAWEDAQAADRLIDSSTNTPYFAAEVAIEQEDFERFYNGARLVPGMPAEVLIKTGERTFIDYILSPLKRTFSTSLLED